MNKTKENYRRKSLKKTVKTGICFLFVGIYILSGPAQIVAIAQEDQIYTGVNDYELQTSQLLTEAEMESMLEELQDPYTANLEEPVVFQETVNNPVADTEVQTSTAETNTEVTEATGESSGNAEVTEANAESSGNTEEVIASEEDISEESLLIQSLAGVMDFQLLGDSPSITVAPLDPRLQIYPISTFTKGKNSGIQLLLSGNVPSTSDYGTFKSLLYTLYKDGDEIESKKTDSLSAFQYPDSGLFGSTQYKGTQNNWQQDTLIQGLSLNQLYYIQTDITYQKTVTVEVPTTGGDGTGSTGTGTGDTGSTGTGTGDTGSTGTGTGDTGSTGTGTSEPVTTIVEHTEQFQTESFSLYQVTEKDTLYSISKYYGISINVLRNDNNLKSKNPGTGSILFLRDPKADVSSPLSTSMSEEERRRLSLAMERKGVEYAKTGENSNGYIDLATGNIMYSFTDFELTEYDGVQFSRTYNATQGLPTGYYGKQMSSLLDMSATSLADGTMIVRTADGGILEFHKDAGAGTTYTSLKKGYTLTVTAQGFRMTTQDLKYYDFNEEGMLLDYGNKKHQQASIQYSATGQLQSVTTLGGRKISFLLDEYERIKTLVEPDNATINYSYDENGYLVGVTNERNYATQYHYDTNGLLKDVTNPIGVVVVSLGYDSSRRVVLFQNGEKQTSTLEYGDHKTILTDANGNKTTYIYNDEWLHTQILYPDGKSISRKLIETGQIAEETDKEGKINKYEYDANYMLNKITLPSLLTLQYKYDNNENLLEETNENGNTTRYEYNSGNNVIKITSSDNEITTKEYDGLGRLIKDTNPNGDTTLYEYNGNSTEITKMTDPKGNITTYTYDACGRNISVLVGTKLSRYEYAPNGLLLATVNSEGVREEYSYDAADKSIGVKDPNGNTVGIQYDKSGRITQIISGDGSTVKYQYDANGNRISETNEKGEITYYSYNENDDVVGETKPNGAKTTYERDALGRVTKETDEDGDTITYVYHATLDKVIRMKDKLGRITTYEYDNIGNLLKETRPGNVVLQYTYDTQNRVLTALDEHGTITSYEYDNSGNITKETQTKGSISKVWNRTYDGNNNLLTEKDPAGNVTTYSYDGSNRLLSVTDARGYSSTYVYDELGQVFFAIPKCNNVQRKSVTP